MTDNNIPPIPYTYFYHRQRIAFEPFLPLDTLGGYDPHALFDSLKRTFDLKTDYELARLLDVRPVMISKIRHFTTSVTSDLLLRMHDKTGLSIAELRRRLGVL